MLTYKQLWEIQEPLLAMAGVIQVYLQFSGFLEAWKKSCEDWWFSLQLVRWPDRHIVSKAFLKGFYLIYGDKMLSLRRFISSSIVSILLVLVFYWLMVRIGQIFFQMPLERNVSNNDYYEFIGYFDSKIHLLSMTSISFAVFDSIGINIIPDFISLAGTAWVIKLASNRNSNIFRLVALDLFLTTSICILTFIFAFIYSQLFIFQLPVNLYEFSMWFNLASGTQYGTNPAYYWAVVLTTYSTSLIWFVFLISVGLLSVIRRTAGVFIILLESKWITQLPVVLLVGIPCLFSWVALYLIRQVYS